MNSDDAVQARQLLAPWEPDYENAARLWVADVRAEGLLDDYIGLAVFAFDDQARCTPLQLVCEEVAAVFGAIGDDYEAAAACQAVVQQWRSIADRLDPLDDRALALRMAANHAETHIVAVDEGMLTDAITLAVLDTQLAEWQATLTSDHVDELAVALDTIRTTVDHHRSVHDAISRRDEMGLLFPNH